MAKKIEVELAFQGEATEKAKAILGEVGADKVELRSRRGLTGIETVLVCGLLAEETARRLPSWSSRGAAESWWL